MAFKQLVITSGGPLEVEISETEIVDDVKFAFPKTRENKMQF